MQKFLLTKEKDATVWNDSYFLALNNIIKKTCPKWPCIPFKYFRLALFLDNILAVMCTNVQKGLFLPFKMIIVGKTVHFNVNIIILKYYWMNYEGYCYSYCITISLFLLLEIITKWYLNEFNLSKITSF